MKASDDKKIMDYLFLITSAIQTLLFKRNINFCGDGRKCLLISPTCGYTVDIKGRLISTTSRQNIN